MASKRPIILNSSLVQTEITTSDNIDSAVLSQPLSSLSGYNSNGLLTQTATNTFTGRTITGTASQIDVTNGNGVSGNPTLSFSTIGNLTVLGNVSGGTAVPIALTATQLTTIPNLFTSALKGLVPLSGGGSTNFLRADGTWAAPSGSGVTSVAQSLTGLSILSISGSPITTSGTLALSANCSTGDIPYGSASNTLSSLAIGGTNKILAVSGGIPSWQNGWMGSGAITSNTTLTVTSSTFQTISSAGGAVTVTLPDAATSTGKVFVFKKIAGSNAASVQRAGADTIDGATSLGFNTDVQNQTLFIESDGTTTWRVIRPVNSGAVSEARYTSSGQTITAGGALTLSHGLADIPREIWYDLQCVTAELGFTVGQRLAAQAVTGKNGSGPAMAIVADATNINIRFNNGSPVFQVCRFDTGAQVNITNANWNVVFYARI